MSEGPNQGATGSLPPAEAAGFQPGAAAQGESPLSVETEGGAFAENPLPFIGGAFAGGLALALIVRKVSR
jgi:hypothetical protein